MSVGLGNIFCNYGCRLGTVRGGKDNSVMGVTSMRNAITTPVDDTCATAGRTIIKLAGGVTTRCNLGGVHYGSMKPNCVGAPLLSTRLAPRVVRTLGDGRILKHLNRSSRMTGLILFLDSSRTSFIANTCVLISNNCAVV